MRARLLALWFLLFASALATGILLFEFYRQSAAVQVAQAGQAVARACRDLEDRYTFLTAGWSGPAQAGIDDDLRHDLTTTVQAALARASGIEGGVWQAGVGSLAYAFPTYEGTGPKTDLPVAELATIRQVNADALRSERPVTLRRSGRSQVLVLEACPLRGPISDATGWAMTRAFTGQGPAHTQLLAGLGVLTLTVLGSAGFLGWLLFAWSRRIGQIEMALASHDGQGDVPLALPFTGERELDRLVDALNASSVRLAEARRRASSAERLAAVGRLAAGLAHEIRNPIAAMRLKAENALAAGGTAEAIARKDRALGVILEQVGRLDGLLSNLLSSVQQPAPTRAPQDVAAFLNGRADLFREQAEAKGVTLQVEVAPDAMQADFDGVRVAQAVDNLIVNSLDSTPRNGRIDLRARREDRILVLSVADTGGGVPETIRDTLFDPFVTAKAEGTGLGLAIVREAVEAHDGRVCVTHRADGTTFVLELPAWP